MKSHTTARLNTRSRLLDDRGSRKRCERSDTDAASDNTVFSPTAKRWNPEKERRLIILTIVSE